MAEHVARLVMMTRIETCAFEPFCLYPERRLPLADVEPVTLSARCFDSLEKRRVQVRRSHPTTSSSEPGGFNPRGRRRRITRMGDKKPASLFLGLIRHGSSGHGTSSLPDGRLSIVVERFG